MKFWIPVKTPKQFISAVEKIIKEDDPPVRVSIEEMSLPGRALFVISKFGTSTIEIELLSDADGMCGTIVKQNIASFHRAFIDKVDAWLREKIIDGLGGKVIEP